MNPGHKRNTSSEPPSVSLIHRRKGRLATAFGTVLAGVIVLAPFAVNAQTNRAKARLPENRYLLIVETSRAMQRRADGTFHAVSDLLSSSIRGELHRNDTLGVWTFNDELHAGVFPLQHWTPEGRSVINAHVVKFLTEQKMERSGNLDKVFASLGAIARDSETLTVILVTTGEGKIHGTPFDDVLNQGWSGWREQQQKAHMPVVTVLRAQAGRWTNYSLTAPPWQVEMPPWPAETPVAAAAPVSANPKSKIDLPTNWVETVGQNPSTQVTRAPVPPSTAPRIESQVPEKRVPSPAGPAKPAGILLGQDPVDDSPQAKVVSRPGKLEVPAPAGPVSTQPVFTASAANVPGQVSAPGSSATDKLSLASTPFQPLPPAKTQGPAVEILKGPDPKPIPATSSATTSAPPAVAAKSIPASSPLALKTSLAATSAPAVVVAAPSAPATSASVPINPAKTPASVAAPTIPAAAAFSGNTFLISAVILLSGACLFLLATRHRVPPQKVSLITRSMDPGQS